MCNYEYIEILPMLCITTVKNLGYFSFIRICFHFPRCLNHPCLNMNSTWTGAPGCINDSLLTGLEFVDGFQSYFFVKRWTMHQLVNSCSQLISSVTILELNFDRCKNIFPRTDFHFIFKSLNHGLITKKWVWSSSNELPFFKGTSWMVTYLWILWN